jgi:cytochrome P450
MPVALPVRLDPASRDLHGQNAQLRAQGPVVLVELPGGVTAWAVTRYRVLRALLSDPRVAANSRHWRTLNEGGLPDGWPLLDFITVRSMTTADGPDHRRLRALVSQAFTPRRVAVLRPGIERAVAVLLDELEAELAAHGEADLVERFAYRLPLTVICDLMGFPVERRPELHRLCARSSDNLLPPAEKKANSQALFGLLATFAADRRADPRDDLTTALIDAVTEDGEVLSEPELVGTLLTVLLAGHLTVTRLIGNAVRALLTHPAQLALVTSGQQPWSAVIEETLRWDSPVGHFPMRYATEDLDLEGTTIRRGDAIILSYAAAGRDDQAYPGDAEEFRVARPPAPHLSFGHGVHFCVGATLARTEAEIALPALFSRFPELTAVAPEGWTPIPSLVSNGVQTLTVGREPAS